ncbi:MAG: methylmalonyl-CoA mutase family protein [Nocardioides sp.]
MTSGPDEPEEFELEQGSLALLLPGDDHGRGEWERAAAGVLRKARRMTSDEPDDAVWHRLAHTTLDDIVVTPLGTPTPLDDVGSIGRPAGSGGWDVRVEVAGAHTDPLNAEVLADLEGGASSLWLRTDADTDLGPLLNGVLLDLAAVVLDAPDDPVGAAEAFLTLLGDATPAPGTNLGVAGIASDDVLVAVAEQARSAGVLGVVVDARAVHDRGASDAQELGWSMATGARVLRVLNGAGIPLEEAAALVEFRYGATDEQLPTIAKLRAARRLWTRLLALSEVDPIPQRQHVVTSRPMMSAYDPWVNMLRTTVAAFAAGVGGADAITVVPFDSPLGRPDAFGRRIARNTSAVLVAESHVGTVADPAGGSFAVEKLTHDLCLAAWEVLGALERGESLDGRIAATVARRDDEIATRRRPITGLTHFPHLGEALPVREPDPSAPDVRRYGAGFEALRDTPVSRPVFLATLGPVAAHTTRAGFAANLLAAGGIPVEAAGPTDGMGDLLAVYGGQPVVCLAGNDASYDAWGADAIAALRAAGARHVIVAGRISTSSITENTVDDSCAVGVDALAFLHRTREALR